MDSERDDAQKQREIRENLERFERLFGTDEDAYEQPTTTRRELWSYYLYYNGDNGVGPLSYSQALFQSALSRAGSDPHSGSPCSSTTACVVPWGPHGTKNIASVVLIANGLSFALMTLLFVTLGSAADYGTFGRWLLLVLTVICWVFQFGFMAIRHASQWPAAMVLYIVTYIAYGGTLVFYAALFPRLARYMPGVRKARQEMEEGRMHREEYEKVESLERNHISSVSTAHSNIGYLCTLAINLSVLIPLEGRAYANNLALLLTNCYWIVLGIWWFIFQQPRPGPKLPKGSSYLTIGWQQILLAARSTSHLPQTFLYLISFFLLSDGLNTTSSLVSIIQNTSISFSFLQLTYLGLTQALCSIASTFGFWYFQRAFQISTKRMFIFTNFWSCVIPFYGMLGLWTTRIGYHNPWEFYFYNVLFGCFQAPYYAYAQTMMSEVTPRGYEGMFFGLFGITNRASSVIGPNVVQAIVDSTGNSWMGFPFVFALCAAASVCVWAVDVQKGRENCRVFVEERKLVRTAREAGLRPAEVVEGAAEGTLGVAAGTAGGVDTEDPVARERHTRAAKP